LFKGEAQDKETCGVGKKEAWLTPERAADVRRWAISPETAPRCNLREKAGVAVEEDGFSPVEADAVAVVSTAPR